MPTLAEIRAKREQGGTSLAEIRARRQAGPPPLPEQPPQVAPEQFEALLPPTELEAQEAERQEAAELEAVQAIPVPEEYGLTGARKLAYQQMRLGKRREKEAKPPQRLIGATLGLPGKAVSTAAEILGRPLEYVGEKYDIPGLPTLGRGIKTGVRMAAIVAKPIGLPILASEVLAGVAEAVAGTPGATKETGKSVATLVGLKVVPKVVSSIMQRFGVPKPAAEGLVGTAVTTYFTSAAGISTAADEYARTGDVGAAVFEGIAQAAGTAAGMYVGGKIGKFVPPTQRALQARGAEVRVERAKARGKRAIEAAREGQIARQMRGEAERKVALEAQKKVAARERKLAKIEKMVRKKPAAPPGARVVPGAEREIGPLRKEYRAQLQARAEARARGEKPPRMVLPEAPPKPPRKGRPAEIPAPLPEREAALSRAWAAGVPEERMVEMARRAKIGPPKAKPALKPPAPPKEPVPAPGQEVKLAAYMAKRGMVPTTEAGRKAVAALQVPPPTTKPPTYAELQAKVPPGMPGGLPGQPPPLPGEIGPVKVATTEAAKITKIPAGKKVLRQPTPAEITKSEQAVKTAIAEVKAHKPAKYPELPGVVTKPTAWQRVNQSWPAQLLTGKRDNYETKVERIAPKGSVAHKILMETPREGTTRTAAIGTTADEYMRSSAKRQKITQALKRQHVTGTTSIRFADKTTVKAPASQLVDIVGAWSDGHYKKVLSEQGVVFARGAKPVKMTDAKVAQIRQQLARQYPEIVAKLGDDLMWYRQVGAPLMATAYWRETGKQLKTRLDYYTGRRDVVAVRERGVEALSASSQMERWIKENIEHLRVTGKPPRGLKELGRRAEPELRHIRILKTRQESRAPYLAEDIYTKFYSHTRSVAQYAGKAEAVRDAKMLLYNRDFQQSVRERMADGEIVLRDMRSHLMGYAGLDVQPRGFIDRIVNKLLRNVTVGKLGLKPQTMAIQAVSYFNSLTETPRKYWNSGRKVTDAEIAKHFPVLKQRFEGTGHMIMTPSLARFTQDQVNLSYFGPQPTLGRLGMAGIRKVDMLTIKKIAGDSLAWAEGKGLKGDAALAEANRLAMRTVDRTQPTWDPLTMATIQLEARQSPLKKMLVMFSSQSNKNINMAARGIETYRNSPRTAADKASMIFKVSVPTIINATLVYGISEGFFKLYGYERDKGWADHMGGVLQRMYGGFLITAPIVDNVKQQLIDRLGKKRAAIFIEPRHNPIVEAVDDVPEVIGMWATAIQSALEDARYKAGPKRGQPKFDTQAVRAAERTVRAMSDWLGLPIGGLEQIARPTVRKLTTPELPTRRGRRPRR